MTDVDLSSLVPLESESRWSDTLTALVRTDPQPLLRALGLHDDPRGITVTREVPWDRVTRPDVLVRRDGVLVAALVSKVLADFSESRLHAYERTRPDASAYVLLFPRVFGDRAVPAPWRAVAWEDLLGAYTQSSHAWASATARAWLGELERAVPSLDASTRWDDVEHRSGIGAAVRSRLIWLSERVSAPDGATVHLHGSTGDNGWILSVRAPTLREGYTVVAELDEQLSPRYFADPDEVPRGLAALVALEQAGVSDSRGYDWDLLLGMWEGMRDSGLEWSTSPARPKAPHDLAGQRGLLARGAPVFLGAGFGDKNAKDTGACLFGARVRFAGDATLGELLVQIERIAHTVVALARRIPRA